MTLPSFPNIDLFSAGINALNGVLIARNPSHDRGYTMAGLLIMAFFGGIGGGVSRDVLLNDIPSPFKDWNYLFVCLLMGLLGLAIYRYLESKEERFRTRTLAFFKSFTLPWFAILGAHKALDHGLGVFAAIVIGLISTVAGGVMIDLFSGVTPEIVGPSRATGDDRGAGEQHLHFAGLALYDSRRVFPHHPGRSDSRILIPRHRGERALAFDCSLRCRSAARAGVRELADDVLPRMPPESRGRRCGR